MAKVVAGGYKNFGPTYNSTKYVRFGHEGTVNSMHFIDPSLVPEKGAEIDTTDGLTRELAGKIAMINEDGYVVLCDDGAKAVGLIVDDLGDIANASNKVSYYFRGGEYYISVARMGEGAEDLKPGDNLTVDANGALVKGDEGVVAVVTAAADIFTQGNMYENAGIEANGGKFVGIQLRI